MEPSDATQVPDGGGVKAGAIADVFRGYRAEWLGEDLYSLFTEPEFFPELKSLRPCVLRGGRGTGKTTLLRCLSYEGQFALSGRDVSSLGGARFFGIYYRVNTNVRAFRGAELPQESWEKCFGHYLNLEFCESLLRFVEWFGALQPAAQRLTAAVCLRIASSLGLRDCLDPGELLSMIVDARLRFEAQVNNVGERGLPSSLTLQGAPLALLVSELRKLDQFKEKTFFLLIDEYENLADYQQTVVNTLMKHSGEGYTFKVGVKELGQRTRATLNPSEQLISPADYVLIDIGASLEGRFPDFAMRVCNRRLERASGKLGPLSVVRLFPGLSIEAEADALGAADIAKEVNKELGSDSPAVALSSFELFFLRYVARSEGLSLGEVWKQRLAEPEAWKDRLNNYGFVSLFSLRRGKRGFRRLYAGWSVLTQMAAGNIRFLLELVDTSLQFHLQDDGVLGEPVDPKVQTRAAQHVGRKNLKELEGQSIHGASLTKLLLGLGRVFQVLAWESEGHTPEVTQFTLADPPEAVGDGDVAMETAAAELLSGAVMHTALVRYHGSKLQGSSETRDYDYAVHPVYSALFECSYRRKRKIALTVQDLLGLVRSPGSTIESVLARQRRKGTTELPEQLGLFKAFYASRP